MRNSQILVRKTEEKSDDVRCIKLRDAYRTERTIQEVTEVELNRAKIVMIDEDGNIKRVPILAEH
ncbi:hypothetical protein ACQEXU_02330 [Vibrio sp. TRT 21S02]|uniref:hypothetical protein n=1 Tax=unclassified Vibrio TaxID=2614977 RepID=UPI00349F2682